MSRSLWIAAVLIIASVSAAPAAESEFDAALGKTGTGRCHMDSCSFFQLQTALPIAVLEDGTLFAMSELAWSAEYKPRDDDHEYDHPPVSVGAKTPDAFAVFCSKTRPYIFFDDGQGKWESLTLRPGDPKAMAGAIEAAYNTYWASCHHFITSDAVAAKMAKKLGYNFAGHAGPESDDRIKQPSDLLR